MVGLRWRAEARPTACCFAVQAPPSHAPAFVAAVALRIARRRLIAGILQRCAYAAVFAAVLWLLAGAFPAPAAAILSVADTIAPVLVIGVSLVMWGFGRLRPALTGD